MNFIERHKCPVCENPKGEILFSLSYSSEQMVNYLKAFYEPQGGIKDFSIFNNVQYELIHCNVCGLIYQTNIPDEKLSYKLYEEYINPESKKEELNEGGRYQLSYFRNYSAEIEFMLRKANKPPVCITFLDFGMGWGMLCSMALGYGCITYGTELSPSRIEFAKNKGITVIDYDKIGNLKFDIINLSDVLEHVAYPLELLKDLSASLEKNGLLRVSVPYEKNILSILRNSKNHDLLNYRYNCVSPLEHINCFSQKTLEFLSLNLNLKNVGYMDFIHPIPIDISFLQKSKQSIKKYLLAWRYQKQSTNVLLKKIR